MLTISKAPEVRKKFRRAAWAFEQTVACPPNKDLPRFVAAILAACPELSSLTLTIDDISGRTDQLAALCPAGFELHPGLSLTVDTVEEAHALMLAVLQDHVDGLIVPAPKTVTIYADNDEWVTFYANAKAHLTHVLEPLIAMGCELIKDWTRPR